MAGPLTDPDANKARRLIRDYVTISGCKAGTHERSQPEAAVATLSAITIPKLLQGEASSVPVKAPEPIIMRGPIRPVPNKKRKKDFQISGHQVPGYYCASIFREPVL